MGGRRDSSQVPARLHVPCVSAQSSWNPCGAAFLCLSTAAKYIQLRPCGFLWYRIRDVGGRVISTATSNIHGDGQRPGSGSLVSTGPRDFPRGEEGGALEDEAPGSRLHSSPLGCKCKSHFPTHTSGFISGHANQKRSLVWDAGSGILDSLIRQSARDRLQACTTSICRPCDKRKETFEVRYALLYRIPLPVCRFHAKKTSQSD
jgi:hypothetical protein